MVEMLPVLPNCRALQPIRLGLRNPVLARHRHSRTFPLRCVDTLPDFLLCLVKPVLRVLLAGKCLDVALARLIEVVGDQAVFVSLLDFHVRLRTVAIVTAFAPSVLFIPDGSNVIPIVKLP
jgi:hypothetical protein